MSEDEAFIRTIVDRPGDDLPRLVYADWLDEQNDPRGAYLRAEVEWAKGRREVGWAPPTVEEQERWAVPTLRRMAEGLDAVWVARLSRPPIGVCCDHLTFLQSEPPVTLAEIEEVEMEFGVVLPPQCRALLLNYNGGEPVRDGLILESPDGMFADDPSGWWLHPLQRSNGPGWNESSFRGQLKQRDRNLQRLPPDSRLRFWHERYLTIGTAPPESGEWWDAHILVAVAGRCRYWGNVWISQRDELDDPNFDIEHPRGLQPLAHLLTEIR